ncbi:MAG: NTP transferase domain-containing protein [Chloroflexi bacterium]|nr:NTP transferase domain-containing protein [Chloroflexota bacterium]
MPIPRVSAVLLAAGESTRMGQQKALLPWRGVTLLQHQVGMLLEAGVSEVVVVTGYRSERLRPLLQAFPRTTAALNLRYRTGKSSSVRAGLRAIDPHAEAVLVLSVDQPRAATVVRAVIEAHAAGEALITYPSYQGKGGHPVIFSAKLLPEMLRVQESHQGLREVVERHRDSMRKVEMGDPGVLLDLNRPEDYQRAMASDLTPSIPLPAAGRGSLPAPGKAMSGIESVLRQAAEFMTRAGLGGWLVFDYQGMNPVLRYVVGNVRNITRPCYLLATSDGKARALAHHVDAGRFSETGLQVDAYLGRADLMEKLRALLSGLGGPVAMEYSPLGVLPRASRVDAGTVELVRSLGAQVVSSADLFQYATQRWSPAQLASHQRAATALGEIVLEAYQHIGTNLGRGITEYDVAELIRGLYARHGLASSDGPVVAADAHAADPHFEPEQGSIARLARGQWVLIDLWAREPGEDGTFADITWVGYVGRDVPRKHREVFDLVCSARDTALEFMQRAFRQGNEVQGWQVDRVAREVIEKAGYGRYFTHRLGHSLGATVHADAVNLDSHETHDTRVLMPGLGVTIEPGIYLPEFGMRSEIDVYLSERGPVTTTAVQREVVLVE